MTRPSNEQDGGTTDIHFGNTDIVCYEPARTIIEFVEFDYIAVEATDIAEDTCEYRVRLLVLCSFDAFNCIISLLVECSDRSRRDDRWLDVMDMCHTYIIVVINNILTRDLSRRTNANATYLCSLDSYHRKSQQGEGFKH